MSYNKDHIGEVVLVQITSSVKPKPLNPNSLNPKPIRSELVRHLCFLLDGITEPSTPHP